MTISFVFFFFVESRVDGVCLLSQNVFFFLALSRTRNCFWPWRPHSFYKLVAVCLPVDSKPEAPSLLPFFDLFVHHRRLLPLFFHPLPPPLLQSGIRLSMPRRVAICSLTKTPKLSARDSLANRAHSIVVRYVHTNLATVIAHHLILSSQYSKTPL